MRRWLRDWPIAAVVVAGLGYLGIRRTAGGAVEGAAAASLAGGGVALALGTGCTPEDLGMARGSVRSGLRWGVGAGAVAAGALAAVSVLPVGEDFFADARYADLTGPELLFEIGVRVPLMVAVFEEVVFRGVVYGMVLHRHSPRAAIVVSSALFGLWHAADAGAFAEANDGLSVDAWTVVPATVLTTATAGVVLAWLRKRSGSVLAPIVVHAAVNATGVLLAARVARGTTG